MSNRKENIIFLNDRNIDTLENLEKWSDTQLAEGAEYIKSKLGNPKKSKLHTYMGIDIFPYGQNTMGLKWYCIVDDQKLRADTLPNIKWMIREYMNHKKLGLK